MSLPSHLGGHNYVIIGRRQGLRAATAEEAGCRGLHGFGGYDQENDNNNKKKSSLEWPRENNWLKFKGGNKWKRLETAGVRLLLSHGEKRQ